MKILFVMSHTPNPRMLKRINFIKKFFEVEIIYIKRRNNDMYTFDDKNIKSYSLELNLPTSQQILKRIFISFKFLQFLLKIVKNKHYQFIYAEGLDILILIKLCSLKRKVSYILEVADLRESYLGNKLKNKLLNNLTSLLFKKVDILVITSEKFYEKYFCRYVSKEKVVYIPNIPDLNVFKNYIKKEKKKFTVGFIGGIRYLTQMKLLVDACEGLDIEVLFAGAGSTLKEYEEIEKYCTKKDYVIFTGKYNYKDEIAELYSKVDCVFSAYDNTNPNVKIALPNKLYESIYCELPIIVSKETYLSEIVEKLNIGVSIKGNNIEELRKVLKILKEKRKEYNIYVENCKKNKNLINLEIYNEKLLEKINNCKVENEKR